MEWTDEQEVIFDKVVKDGYHVAIRAVAGSGKTTTMIELAIRISEGGFDNVIFVAFMKSVVEELKAKLKAKVGRSSYVINTLHSEGYKVIRRNYPDIVFMDDNLNVIKDWMIDKGVRQGLIDHYWYVKTLSNIVGICKHYVNLDESSKVCDVVRVLNRYAVKVNPAIKGYELSRHVELALKFVGWWRDNFYAYGIDYKDMVWLPVVLGLIDRPMFDVVIVDEVQDLNPVQHELVKLVGDRVVAVGDPRQAIMGFSGAMESGYDSVVEWMRGSERGFKEFNLSYSFRCPKSHVEMAREFNEGMKSVRGDDGVLGHVSAGEMCKMLKVDGKPTMVLCRNNKPLIELAAKLLGFGLDVSFMDKNVLNAIVRVVKGNSEDQIRCKVERLKVKVVFNDDQYLKYMLDIYSVSLKLLDMFVRDKVKQALKLIWNIKPNGKQIRLSTVHKAKGLECGRVFVYMPELIKLGEGQEDNLAYVALTRSLSEMFIVGKFEDVSELNEF